MTEIETPPAVDTSRRRPPRLLLGGAAVLLAAIAAVIAVVWWPSGAEEAEKPKTFPVRGTMAIDGGYSQTGTDGEPCNLSQEGYADIPGAQVVITDAAGKTIATTALPAQGRLQTDVVPGTVIPLRTCDFAFAVDVPQSSEFYGVQIANRGRLQYSRAQLNAPLQLDLR